MSELRCVACGEEFESEDALTDHLAEQYDAFSKVLRYEVFSEV